MRTQPRSTTPGRRVALLVAAALLLGAGSVAFDAATAHAAVSIGPQETIRPPAVFPVDFPGRDLRQGGPIPAGDVVLRRRVSMTVGEKRRALRFTCPRKTVALQPRLNDPSDIGIAITDLGQYRHPTRTFRLVVFPAPADLVKGPVARGRVYLLCGPRRSG